jgi:hypothetical protein
MSLTFFYLYYVVGGFMMSKSLNQAILDSGFSIISTLIGFLILNVMLVHGATKMFGAKKNLQKTFQVHVYAYTPYFLFGWLWTLNTEGSPLEIAFLVLGVVFSLLSVINGVSGLKYIHKLSTIKSVIAEFFVPLFAYVSIVILYMIYGAQYGLI